MRIPRLLAAATSVALLAAACGDGDDTGTGGSSESPTSSETATGSETDMPMASSLMDGAIPCENQHDGKRVSIFSPVRDSENDLSATEFRDSYIPLEECTGVEIVWEGTDQFETEINIRLQGGDAPDIIDYPQPGLMAQHARRGFLTELPADMAAMLDTYIAGWDAYATIDGKVYGLPGRSNIKSLVWYSPQMFADGNYDIPESLEELTALSDKIVADGGTPWCVGAESGVATGWVLTDWMEDFFLRTHGADLYDDWVDHTIPFNDPRVVEVVDAVGAFVKNPDYLGGETAVKAIATTKFQDGGLPILSGDCYMHRQASFYSGLWPEGTVVGGDDADVDVFYLPSPADGPAYMLGGGDIYAPTNDDAATLDALRYTGSLEYQTSIAQVRGELVPHKDISPSVYTDPFLGTLAELQLGAEVFRFDGSDLMPGQVGAGSFWTEVTDWVIGGSTQDFVDNVEESWPES